MRHADEEKGKNKDKGESKALRRERSRDFLIGSSYAALLDGAANRGHIGRTKGAAMGGALGGIVGSFIGLMGAALFAAVGAMLGGSLGSRFDR